MTDSEKLLSFPVLSLIVANSIPLLGVLYFDWQVDVIVLLYWAENLIIGFYNILKMALANMEDSTAKAGKLFIIPFFLIHYGGFCAGHGVFIMAFFKFGSGNPMSQIGDWPFFLVFVELLVVVVKQLFANMTPDMFTAFYALIISHGISFFFNYIKNGEYKTTTVKTLMNAPYSRIIVMHIAIIAGGFLVLSMGSPMPLLFVLIVLIVLKIIMDISLHKKSHQKALAAPA